MHWRDMTSTRMECHALLMGLYNPGDQGLQVCDNQAAIRIVATAREIANGTRPRHIAYWAQGGSVRDDYHDNGDPPLVHAAVSVLLAGDWPRAVHKCAKAPDSR